MGRAIVMLPLITGEGLQGTHCDALLFFGRGGGGWVVVARRGAWDSSVAGTEPHPRGHLPDCVLYK